MNLENGLKGSLNQGRWPLCTIQYSMRNPVSNNGTKLTFKVFNEFCWNVVNDQIEKGSVIITHSM